jgi:Ca2+/H+ antiporter, TMEM165/GDT1 family
VTRLLAYATVFVAAAIPWLEVLLVVPAGIVAGLPPIPTAVVGAVGNAATLVPLVLAGDRLRSWWRTRRGRRHDPDPESPQDEAGSTPRGDAEGGGGGRGGRARRLYDRFGLPGMALLGPLLTGVHVAAVVALTAGSPRRPTLGWLLGGIVLWSVLAAAATVYGLEALVDPDDLPDLFGWAR